MTKIFNKNREIHNVLVEPEIGTQAMRAELAWDSMQLLHLVKPLGFNIDDKSVKRAGLDYWKDVKLQVWENQILESQIQDLGDVLFRLKAKKRTSKRNTQRIVLLFGKETAGFSKTIRERYKEKLFRFLWSKTRYAKSFDVRALLVTRSCDSGLQIKVIVRGCPGLKRGIRGISLP